MKLTSLKEVLFGRHVSRWFTSKMSAMSERRDSTRITINITAKIVRNLKIIA